MTDPHHYFREATDTLEPDVEALVGGGLSRGRTRRRRRQVLTTVGSAAAVAVLALASVGVPQLTRSETPVQPADGGGGTSTEAAEDPPAPTASLEPEPERPRRLAVTPAQVPGTVADILGGSVETEVAYPGDRGGVAAHFRWNGAYTSVFVDGFYEQREPISECRFQATRGMTCTERPDGSAELRWQETSPAADGGETGRGLTYYTTDGWALEVISYNVAVLKSGELLADEPPIGYDQMEQVTTSEAWFA